MKFLQSSHDRDLELLSAYIDDELSPAERAKLERRLQADSDLRSVLTELRRVQTTLADLPRLKPPRSFTLKPAMVGQKARQGSSLIPIFNYATSLAAVLFAVLVGAQLATGSGARMAAPAPEAVVAQYAAETEEVGITALEAPAESADVANSNLTTTAQAGTDAFSITIAESPDEPLTGSGGQGGGGGGGEPGTGVAGGGAPENVPPAVSPETSTADGNADAALTATLDDSALREATATETPTPKQLPATPEPTPAAVANAAQGLLGTNIALVVVGAALLVLIGISILLRRR